MSSPINPLVQSSAPVPSPVPANGAASDAQIRLLAEQINNANDPGFVIPTYAKGTVLALDEGSSSTAPTLSITLSGSSVQVDGVRFLATYSPSIGDTVLVVKMGSELLVQAQYARRDSSATASNTEGGWIQPNLSTGNGHNGNTNGNLMYRRVMKDGAWMMEWKGGITYNGSAFILLSALDPIYRPAAKQSLITARENASGAHAIGVDFRTDGTIELIGATVAPFGATPSPSGGFAGYHNHWYYDRDTGGAGEALRLSVTIDDSNLIAQNDHTHGSHHHDVNYPDWVTFTNVSYYLG